MFDDAVYTEASNKCLAFMKSQLNVSNFIYPISFGEAYSDSYAGDVIWGTVSGLPAEDEKVHPQHINMAEYYDYYYTDRCPGLFRTDIRVNIRLMFSHQDLEFLVVPVTRSNGTCALENVTVTVMKLIGNGEPYTYHYEEKSM